MMRRSGLGRAIVAVAAIALTACSLVPGGLPGVTPGGLPGVTPAGRPTDTVTAAAQAPARAMGRLRLAIHWPQGPGRDLLGYHAQLIPDSAATLKVTVKKGATTVTSVDVARTAGAVTNTTIPLHVDTGLTVLVEAYPSGANSGTKIAEATATNVAIKSSADTSVSITLGSLYTPTVATITAYARANNPITLTGTNFAPAWRTTGPTVYFTGSAASVSATPTAVGDTSLTVTVPSGAKTGKVSVKVDGVEGGAAEFEIGATLTINAGGTIPSCTATYKAKVERDADTNGSYETTLFTTDAVAAGSMPMQVTVPQKGAYQVTLDAYPGSNAPATDGGSIAVGTSTLTIAEGTTTASTTPSLASRYAPTLTAISAAFTGTATTLTGTNLKQDWFGTPTVTFQKVGGGTTTGTVTASSATSLTVTVPSDATDDNVTVTADGMTTGAQSFTANPFTTVSTFASVSGPRVLAFDSNGNLIVAGTATLRSIDANANITTLYTCSGSANSDIQAMGVYNDTVYFTCDGAILSIPAGGGTTTVVAGTDGSLGYADGAIGTGRVQLPLGVIAIASGPTLYFSDYGNRAIRTVSSTGELSTIAGDGPPTVTGGTADGLYGISRLAGPSGTFLFDSTTLYVTDMHGNKIRHLNPTTTNLAGFLGTGTDGVVNGAAASAQLSQPEGLAMSGGALFWNDSTGHTIRRYYNGYVTTVAGTGASGSQNGALATATFNLPRGIAMDAQGRIYVGELNNNRIRRIAP